jgi:hypothetical protein
VEGNPYINLALLDGNPKVTPHFGLDVVRISFNRHRSTPRVSSLVYRNLLGYIYLGDPQLQAQGAGEVLLHWEQDWYPSPTRGAVADNSRSSKCIHNSQRYEPTRPRSSPAQGSP